MHAYSPTVIRCSYIKTEAIISLACLLLFATISDFNTFISARRDGEWGGKGEDVQGKKAKKRIRERGEEESSLMEKEQEGLKIKRNTLDIF